MTKGCRFVIVHSGFVIPWSLVIRHFPPGGAYFFSQPNTSLCQCSLFFGFSTQCPSSGKFTNRRRHPLPLQRA